MDDFNRQLQILIDILNRKKVALEQILGITENQETLLSAKESNEAMDSIFYQMNEEKQKLIDEVLNADNFFQKVFSNLSDEFEQKSQNFKDTVKAMQELIRDVMDLDVKIRLQEQHNRACINSSKLKTKTKLAESSRDYIVKQYKKNSIKK